MSKLVKIASDGSGIAFARAPVDKRGRALLFGWSSSGAAIDRSIRAFDGVSYQTLLPNNSTTPQARHNGLQIYCPARDEMWVAGGSDIQPGQLVSGIFSLASNQWTKTATDFNVFSGIIKGGIGFHTNMASAWSTDLDMGLLFGGGGDGVYDDCWLIEPNPAGPEPYKLTTFVGSRPPPRAQAQNLIVAAGSNFYLVGGFYSQVNGNYQFRKDLWKFDGKARAWSRLTDPPADCYAGCVTYDPTWGKVVFWCNDKLFTYSISGVWLDETPAGLPILFNQVGAYLPKIGAHYFEGGNNADISTNRDAYLIELKGVPVSFDIPAKTWAAVPYSTVPPNAPCAGLGSKHLRFAQNLDNGRIYVCGGDYSSNPGDSSFENGLWSYDVPANKWTMEYPYCGNAGEIMPGRPDEVGWVWDSKRKLFWVLPGFMGLVQSGPGVCGSGPNVATQQIAILTFDPATNKWSDPGAAPEPIGIPPGSGEHPKNAIYDPVTDSIYRSGYDYRGVIWTVYHIAKNTWEVFQTPCAPATNEWPASGPCAPNGTYINDSPLAWEYLAADLANRKIYAIDPIHYRLFQFDMDQHTITIKAPIPEPNPARIAQSRSLSWTLKDFTLPVFDSVNNVLLYPYINSLADSRPVLLIYHPDTDTWETDPMHQPDGLEVRGNSAFFDEINNVLCVYGGLSLGGDISGSGLTHFFLYRYGSGGIIDSNVPNLSLGADVTSIKSGDKVTLNWTSTDATSCIASGDWAGDKPLSGSEIVSPTKSSIYTLTASGPGGQASKTVSVIVVQQPIVGPDGFTFICNENEKTALPGPSSVAYGVNGQFVTKDFPAGGDIVCDNITFTDPAVGKVKACFIKPLVPLVPDVIVTVKKGLTVKIVEI